MRKQRQLAEGVVWRVSCMKSVEVAIIG